MCLSRQKRVPQRLKPLQKPNTYGTAEAVPLSKTDFQHLLKLFRLHSPPSLRIANRKELIGNGDAFCFVMVSVYEGLTLDFAEVFLKFSCMYGIQRTC